MDRTELFAQTCYKALLRHKQKEIFRARPNLTWKTLAAKAGVQHTYLSRAFHRSEVHIGEDHLHEMMDLLQFDEVEKEYLLLLRARATASGARRKAYIQARLDSMAREHYVRVDAVNRQATPEQAEFLMNPLLMILYVALHVKKYARSPGLLPRLTGLTQTQIDHHLRQLEEMGMISTGKNGSVTVRQMAMHFSKDHPLMRGSQQIMRHYVSARSAQVQESEKVAFMATFSAPEGTQEKIRDEFYRFLAKAQALAAKGDGERVYQMSFDLFPWD